MKRKTKFQTVRFTADVIAHAITTTHELGKRELENVADEEVRPQCVQLSPLRSVVHGRDSWTYDDDTEWYSEYRRGSDEAIIERVVRVFTTHETNRMPYYEARLYVRQIGYDIDISVEAPTRRDVLTIFAVFEQAEEACKLPTTLQTDAQQPMTVFLGHGRSPQWRDLKDHLHDKQGYHVEAYEVGARAGHSIRDILGSMLEASSFALLVMTGEDEQGESRAPQNVVHEAGLFQGKLGFDRAIAVVEVGVKGFSNLDGVQQIQFAKDHIDATYGEILATLRREFGDRR